MNNARSIALILCFLSVTIPLFSSEGQKSSNSKLFGIYFKIIPDNIIGGNVNDLKNTLTPTPDSTPVFLLGAGLDFYLFNHFGVTAGYDFNGTLIYLKEGYKTLTIANFSKIFAGLIGNFNLFILRDDSSIYSKTLEFNLKLTAGGNYTFFDLTTDYKSVFSGTGFVFYAGPASGFGFFAGGGFEIVIRDLLIGVNVLFNYLNFQFNSAPSGFTMMNLEVPIYAGITF